MTVNSVRKLINKKFIKNERKGVMAIKNVVQFLQEVKIELTKIIWPKFDDFFGSTVVVLVLVLLFAIYLGSIDFGFSLFARYIFKTYGNY